MPTFFFPFDFFQGNGKPQKRRGKLERNWISTILFIKIPKYSNNFKKKKKKKKKRKKERKNKIIQTSRNQQPYAFISLTSFTRGL